MATKLEVAVHTAMSGEKALCLPYRFEPLHLSFSSPGRLMRNLYSVVQIATLPVFDLRQDVRFGSRVAFQFIRDNHPRRCSSAAEQFSEKPLGRIRVTMVLHQNVPHYSVLIDSPPKIMDLSPDPEKHFIKVHLSPGFGRRRLRAAAYCRPKRMTQSRMLSWLTVTPRAARISSTSRRLRLKQ